MATFQPFASSLALPFLLFSFDLFISFPFTQITQNDHYILKYHTIVQLYTMRACACTLYPWIWFSYNTTLPCLSFWLCRWWWWWWYCCRRLPSCSCYHVYSFQLRLTSLAYVSKKWYTKQQQQKSRNIDKQQSEKKKCVCVQLACNAMCVPKWNNHLDPWMFF